MKAKAKTETAKQLRNCAKSGCIRILGASATERRIGADPAPTITLCRAEAVGLFALASAALKAEGDEFISAMTDVQALKYLEYLDRTGPRELGGLTS